MTEPKEWAALITTGGKISAVHCTEANDLVKTLQGFVDGYFEIVNAPAFAPLVFVLNEDGKMLNFPVNTKASILLGATTPASRIRGDVVVASLGEEDIELLDEHTARGFARAVRLFFNAVEGTDLDITDE